MTFKYDHENFEYEVNGEQLILVNAHCDNRVLHAPGHCEYCDKYPEAQMQRVDLGIRFTGEPDEGIYLPDPAEDARGYDSLNGWGGNQPHGQGVSQEEKDYFQLIERPESKMMYGNHHITQEDIDEFLYVEPWHLNWLNLLLDTFVGEDRMPTDDEMTFITTVFHDMNNDQQTDIMSWLFLGELLLELEDLKL